MANVSVWPALGTTVTMDDAVTVVSASGAVLTYNAEVRAKLARGVLLTTDPRPGSSSTVDYPPEEIDTGEPTSVVALRSLAGDYQRQPITADIYDTGNTRGGGLFRWDGASALTEDRGIYVGSSATGRWIRNYSGPADVAWWGAVGDGVTDDTAALQRAFASPYAKWFTLAGRTYLINLGGEGSSYYLAKWTSQSGIRIDGEHATISDQRTYSNTAVFTHIFWFDACSNVSVNDVNYTGQALASPSSGTVGVGYLGATFVGAYTSSTNISVTARVNHALHGVRSGDYTTYALGSCRGLRVRLDTSYCGYPIATYLCNDIDATIYAERTHRAAYIAGCNGLRIDARFKDQYTAKVQVYLTDARDGASSSRGCSNVDVTAIDVGSTVFAANSWCCGVGGEHQYSTVRRENMRFRFGVVGSDDAGASAVATTVGGFTFANSGGNPFHTSSVFRNIVVTGTVDRTQQTIADHGVGEIYAYAQNTDATYPIVDGLTFENVVIRKGALTPARALYVQAQGLTSSVNMIGCELADHKLLATLNSTYGLRAVNCRITEIENNGAYPIVLTGCALTVPLVEALAATTQTTAVEQAGSAMKPLTKYVDVTLSGATTTASNAIPDGALLLGVSGVVRTLITGASGFEVGDGTTATLFADKSLVAVGSSFTPDDSAAGWTGPKQFKAANHIVITAKTSNFTGGVIRLVLHYVAFTAPASS